MQKYIPILKQTLLFAGGKDPEISTMLTCLGAKLSSYPKGSFVFRRGDRMGAISLLLKGALLIQKDDYWGNRSILGQIGVGEIFGEAYAAGGEIRNDVVAVEESAVLSFDIGRLLTACSSACPFHARVVQNLFFAVSEKNRILVQKLGFLSARSIRAKLIAYLSEEASQHGSARFTVPFNRQELADFLSVDRSALSNELSKMRSEGLLRYRKNEFELL